MVKGDATMEATAILERLRELGVTATADIDGCIVTRPKGKIPPDLGAAIREKKAELLSILTKQTDRPPGFAATAADRGESNRIAESVRSPAPEPAEGMDVRCSPEYLAARTREEDRRMLEQQQLAQHGELMAETAVRLDKRAGMAPDSITANQQRARDLIDLCRGLGFTMRLDGGEVLIDFNGRGYTRTLVRELQMYAAEITPLVAAGWGIH
jgi:hypothetical protein